MAVLGINVSCRISRLNLLPSASLIFSVKAFRRNFGVRKQTLQSLHPRQWRKQLQFTTIDSLPPFSSFSSHFATSQFVSPLAGSGEDNLVILGIETSCDDTAAAVVRGDGKILSQVVSSQICLCNMEELPLKWQKKPMQKSLTR